jgi:hypothetical protein
MHEQLTPDQIIMESIDRVCTPGSKTIADLCIQPLAFAQVAQECIREIYRQVNSRAETKTSSHYI